MTVDDLELRELLRWYANGRLPPEQQRLVGEALARSPDLRAALAGWKAVRDHRLTPSADLGLSALLARIEAEEAGKPAPPARRTQLGLRTALALAGSLVLAQAVAIGVLVHQRETQSASATDPRAPSVGALLQVTFTPSATEQELRALLGTIGAEIVAGPGASRAYTLHVEPGGAQAARDRLAQTTDLIESVAVLRP